MKVIKGEKAVKETMQDDFPKDITCKNCNNPARIVFVAIETYPEDGFDKAIKSLYKHHSKFWPHDLTAFAIYICESCGEASCKWNQL